jgi:hypothetical protein
VHSDGKFYFASVTHIVLWCDGLGGTGFSHECPARLPTVTNNSDIFGATLLVGAVVMRSIAFKVRPKSISFHLALMVFVNMIPFLEVLLLRTSSLPQALHLFFLRHAW